MAPACVRVSSYCLISGCRRSGLRVLGAGQAQLGVAIEQAFGDFAGRSSSPCPAGTRPRGSRLPSVRNSLADLPMRCVNITSWPTADSSAGVAFCCSFSDDTVSAISSRSDDWRLMVRSACAHLRQDLLLAHHGVGVLLGAIHQRQHRLDGVLHAAGSGGRVRRRRCAGRARWRPTRSAASFTSGNACALPTRACDTDLASRCDCISD